MTKTDKTLQQNVDRHLDMVFMWEEIEEEISSFHHYIDGSSMESKYKKTLNSRLTLLKNI